jgi:hypothetical protein
MRAALSLSLAGRSLYLSVGADLDKDDTVADRTVAAAEQLGGGTGLTAELDGQDDAGELKAARLRRPFGYGGAFPGGGHV